ncbi:auxin-responsive protein IAA10-like isoform X2 [Phoenix dactylifera]|uniref:Auxin-responsive protein n=1 Tax=Phoenix dactylifera TaxID=42345 RepID=A0A8B8JA22_PHODC|nr:auxin-responsive protein IAA10-like isoform X2 [Phoenix dactylifera]
MMAGGGSSSGSLSTVSKGPPPPPEAEEDAVEKDYVGLSEESSSCYPGGKGDDGETEEKEDEELELGLSLGAKKANAGASRGRAPRREYCRILTAEDFPSLVSRASPLSSSSSVSSSSATLGGGGGGGGAGSRRVAVSGAPDAVGSTNPPPSQMVVGWPPIRAYRMNSLVNQSKDNTYSNAAVTTSHKKTNESSNNHPKEVIARELEKKRGLVGKSPFVKVKMDGDPIGRKVDLNAHSSYETLAVALEAMFHKSTAGLGAFTYVSRTSKLLDGSSEFALTYEDKDGDWMLVGDVPWGMFLSTVKRLRIMRTSDSNGLDHGTTNPNEPFLISLISPKDC